MMMSSMMGAIAFQKGLGLIHSCAHALSTVADLHHGYANGVMIDHALKFNLESSRERFARMAMTIGLQEHTGEAFLAWLRDLKKRIGIPAGPGRDQGPARGARRGCPPSPSRTPATATTRARARRRTSGRSTRRRSRERRGRRRARARRGAARGREPGHGRGDPRGGGGRARRGGPQVRPGGARPEGMGAGAHRRPQGGHRAVRPARAGAHRGPGRDPHRRDGQAHHAVAQRGQGAPGADRLLPRQRAQGPLRGGGGRGRRRPRGGEDLLRADRRRRQHLGLELPVLRRLQRLRARAAHRQRRAVQAVGVRVPHRARRSAS